MACAVLYSSRSARRPPPRAERKSKFLSPVKSELSVPTPEEPRLDRADVLALLAAMAFPSLLTWLYFVALADQPTVVQQVVYTAGKTIQFAFPLVWVLAVRRQGLRWNRPQRRGLAEGIVFGLLAFALIVGGYHVWFQPAGWLAEAGPAIQKKVAGFGVHGPLGFLALGAFYAIVHSLLEEYYWRWFVFGQLRRLAPLGAAMLVGSLAFMAHHVILLRVYFGGQWVMTVAFSLAVAAAGAAWCWIYHRSGSLLGPWLSHLLADAAIFAVGYELMLGR